MGQEKKLITLNHCSNYALNFIFHIYNVFNIIIIDTYILSLTFETKTVKIFSK